VGNCPAGAGLFIYLSLSADPGALAALCLTRLRRYSPPSGGVEIKKKKKEKKKQTLGRTAECSPLCKKEHACT